jgi:hypothetical protein
LKLRHHYPPDRPETLQLNRVTGDYNWAPQGAEPRLNPRTETFELAAPDEELVYRFDHEQSAWRWQFGIKA